MIVLYVRRFRKIGKGAVPHSAARMHPVCTNGCSSNTAFMGLFATIPRV